MQTWKWLYNPENSFTWRFVRNVIIKALLVLLIANVLFATFDPLPTLGRLSAYNVLFKGRDRLPYGENPQQAYNLSLYQLDAMFTSHKLDAADRHDEFRVLVIGDSSVWGILLRPDETLTGQINVADHHTETNQHIQTYNLGYPTMSLTKDLMLLDYAMRYEPDLIVWLVTLESFDQATQLDSAIVQNNAERVQELITAYNLNQNPQDTRFVTRSLWERTIIKRRRALADIFRLQYYGVAWSVTGIDQDYREDYTPRAVDLDPDESWHKYQPDTLEEADLAFDVLNAGIKRAGNTPVILVNEPMLISAGENSNIRYNAFYPHWAYDEFRRQLHTESEREGWLLLDLWDYLPDADCYTDSAVHLIPACSAQLADKIGLAIVQFANSNTLPESGIDHMNEFER